MFVTTPLPGDDRYGLPFECLRQGGHPDTETQERGVSPGKKSEGEFTY